MLESHHVVPVYIQKYFDQLNPNHTLPRKPNGEIDFDECPALSLWWENHRGAGDSIHGLMKPVIQTRGNHGFPDSEGLFTALNSFYQETLNRPGAAKAVREYLNSHGLP